MDINQLTTTINAKHSQLEQQISHLQQQLVQAHGEEAHQLERDLNTLEQLQLKLTKSRDLALRAHELQTNQTGKNHQKKRMLGIGLCVFSGLGLLALLTVVLTM